MIIRASDRAAVVLLEMTLGSGEVTQRPVALNINSRQYLARIDITSEPGAGPLPVQSDSQEAFTPAAIELAFGAAPAEGHLLILCLNTPTAVSTDLAALGYTRVVGGTSSGAMYWKVAGASEPATLSVAFASSGSRGTATWDEFEQMDATPVDVFTSNASTGDVSSKSSGTTGVTAQENELAVAMFYFGTGTTISGRSWTNGFIELNNSRNIFVGVGYLDTEATVETTLAWTSGVKAMAAHIVTFKAAVPEASPSSPRQFISRFVALEVAAEVRANLYGHSGLAVSFPEEVESGEILLTGVGSLQASFDTRVSPRAEWVMRERPPWSVDFEMEFV